jgi:hypothetical protein
MRYFIDSHLLIIQNHGTVLFSFFSVVDVDKHPDHSSSVTVVRQFLTCISIDTHFAIVNHCFHVVPKVYSGFLSLAHIQPTKIIMLHVAIL